MKTRVIAAMLCLALLAGALLALGPLGLDTALGTPASALANDPVGGGGDGG
ncbi:MAG TPA: hypothetical protein VFS21_35170 [Roseiflexaceae bacterium]|nr:hypothetical protein [Roseiflexaceae bacterium]